MNIEMPGLLARLFQGADRAMTIWSSRRTLERMDDRMLQDLGLSRAQASFEAQRPFWDLPPRDGH